MSNWNKNISWYGNLNKLIALGVVLSIPILGLGIWLWSQYLAAKVAVYVVLGLLGLGLLAKLVKWTTKSLGIGSLKSRGDWYSQEAERQAISQSAGHYHHRRRGYWHYWWHRGEKYRTWHWK